MGKISQLKFLWVERVSTGGPYLNILSLKDYHRILIDPFWGKGKVYLIIFALIGLGFFLMPLGTSPSLISLFIALIASIFTGKFFNVKELFRSKWFLSIFFVVILHWIAVLYTEDNLGFSFKYASKTYYWLFALLIASIGLNKKQLEAIILLFLLALAINAFIGIFQFLGILPPKYNWYTGLPRGYNSLSLYLVLGIMVSSVGFYLSSNGAQKAMYLAFYLLYLVHLILLEGRTGYFVCILLFPFSIINIMGGNERAHLFLLIALIILGLFILSPVVQKRLSLTLDELAYHLNASPDKAWGREYTAYQDRFYMWKGAWDVFKSSPLIGAGTGGYSSALKRIRPDGDPIISHPHNNLFYLLANFGIVGFALFLFFFWYQLKLALPFRKDFAGSFVFYAYIVILLGGVFNTTILDSGTLMLISLATGMNGLIQNIANNSKIKSTSYES